VSRSARHSIDRDLGMAKRTGAVGKAMLLLFLLLFGNLFKIQVVDAKKLANHPGNTRNAVRDFGQLRGSMFTADGVLIAKSSRNPNRQSKFEYLRSYPIPNRYGHITGYFSFTYGSTGVERSANDVLAGREGALVISRGKLEQILNDRTEVSDVTLTINDEVQKAAAAALGERKGSVVVIDTRTGAVLALYSWPTFNPGPLTGLDQKTVKRAYEALANNDDQPLLARAWRQLYPPGSTFKVITTAAALQSGTVTAETEFPSISELPLPQTTRPLKNFGGGTCGGTLANSFVVSCNTTFAQIGLDLGPDELGSRARSFGFDQRPPLDIAPGPVASRFPPSEFFKRNAPGLAQGAIGQGDVAATPLQMALVAAGIANGGKVPSPYIVAKVQERSGAVVRTGSSETWTTATTPEVADAIKAMMIDVVANGTGKRASVEGVTVAAKTGTAQTTPGRSSGTGAAPQLRAHAWTIGFAPAEAPRVAIAVIIENQNEVSTTTGGKIAAPVLSKVMTTALQVTK
jgi:penicillin-binding protein A